MIFSRIFKNSLISSSITYTISNIVNLAIPFLLLPVMTRFLSPEDYGIVSMFSVLVSIMTSFVGLNVHGAIVQQFYEKDSINFPKYLTNCFYIMIALLASFLLTWFLSTKVYIMPWNIQEKF